MRSINFRHRFVVLIATVCISGCSNQQAQRDAVIEKSIDEANSMRDEAISASSGTLADVKVYRDGTNDGVVFEYIYYDNVQLDNSQTSEDLKRELVGQFASQPDIIEALKLGVYVRMVYRKEAGEIINDVKITDDDL